MIAFRKKTIGERVALASVVIPALLAAPILRASENGYFGPMTKTKLLVGGVAILAFIVWAGYLSWKSVMRDLDNTTNG